MVQPTHNELTMHINMQHNTPNRDSKVQNTAIAQMHLPARQLGLQHLPAELMLAVAGHLSAPDIKAMRLVSKTLCANSEDVFLSTFFTERIHIYTEESLEALVGITSCAGLLRKLTSVDIVFWEVALWHLVSPKCSEFEDEHDEEACQWPEVEFQKLAKDDKGLLLLVSVLSNLRDNGVRVSMVVSDRSSYHASSVRSEKIYGLSELRNELCYYGPDGERVETWLELRHRTDDFARLVLRALIKAQYRPRRLTLYNNDGDKNADSEDPGRLSHLGFDLSATDMIELRSLLNSLAGFEMRFRMYPSFHLLLEDDEGNTTLTRNAKQVLQSLGSLETLSLAFCEANEHQVGPSNFKHLFQCLHTDRLRSLCLSRLTCHVEDLECLLKKNAAGLRHLDLSHVAITGTDHLVWPKMLLWLASELELETLRLRDLTQCQSYDGFYIFAEVDLGDGCRDCAMKWHFTGNVSQELRTLAATGEVEYWKLF